jgi:hypothetical protein
VTFVVAGKDGEGNTSGFERKMKEVRIEVTVSETERPGFERSSMYQRTGFTRASVRVSWRVDCQGRRRCRISYQPTSIYQRKSEGLGNLQ